jgi:hypothetical protein
MKTLRLTTTTTTAPINPTSSSSAPPSVQRVVLSSKEIREQRRAERWALGEGKVHLNGPRDVQLKKVILDPPESHSPSSDSPVPHNQPIHLPYHVDRTGTNNLPVYLDLKAGKTLRQTRIRKIVGDVHKLKDDLVKELGLNPEFEKAEVGAVTGHIVIKGWHRAKVENFLKGKGF